MGDALPQQQAPGVMGPRVPCCVKSRVSQGSAELFSQLPSPGRSYQWNWFSICMKLRQMFYTQIERRTFHTACFAETTRDGGLMPEMPDASEHHGDPVHVCGP